MSVLSRGLNFAPAPRKIPVPQIIAAVEDGLHRVQYTNSMAVEVTRSSLVGILQRAKPLASNLQPSDFQALKASGRTIHLWLCQQTRAVHCCNGQKGVWWQNHAGNSSGTYKKLARDPAASREHQMNEQLLSLNRAGSLVQTVTELKWYDSLTLWPPVKSTNQKYL